MCSLFFTFLEIKECKYFNELSALTSLSGYTSLEYYVRSAGLVVRISSGGERNMGDFVLKWGERPSTLEDTMSDSLVTLITQNSFFTCKGAKNELLFFIENLRNIHQLSLISNIHLKNLIFRHQKTPLNHLHLKSVHSPSLELNEHQKKHSSNVGIIHLDKNHNSIASKTRKRIQFSHP